MQDERFEDLKRFIEATVAQAEGHLRDEVRSAVSGSEERLRQEFRTTSAESEARLSRKVDDGFAGVGEAMDGLHQDLDERDRAVDQRLTKLEPRAA